MTKRVVVLDSISPEGLALLDAANGIEYEVRTGLSGPELRAALAEFDGAIWVASAEDEMTLTRIEES